MPKCLEKTEFFQFWFLSRTREGEKNQQHMDGLDPDLGKVFLCGKTYDWRFPYHSLGENREQEQRAPDAPNSHGSSLRKG